MSRIRIIGLTVCLGLAFGFCCLLTTEDSLAETASDYSLVPPFVTAGAPPLVMLVLGRDHKLYYEAYDDHSDLNGDGVLDVGYNPAIDYYGYFDCNKCYDYSSSNTRFEPYAKTTNKKCTGTNAGKWSGNFLNYLTMSRMDCMRKVLYGGYRSTDSTTETVLQRAYIPQDGHSWGKEYESVARDGYDIREYTPLSLPQNGFRHLFASTATSDNGTPLLRVLPNNVHRIWEWISKERPVAGKGGGSCTNASNGSEDCESSGGNYTGYPANHNDYESLVQKFANADHLLGTRTSTSSPSVTQINGSGNPFSNPYTSPTTASDYYLHIFTGNINIQTEGDYQFGLDGDDAVEVIIDGVVVAGWYGPHGNSSDYNSHSGAIHLTTGNHSLVYRHQEAAGGDNYYLYWKGPGISAWTIVPAARFQNLTDSFYDVHLPSSTMTDYTVRVLVGVASMPESNCKQYPSGVYKPTGILQRNGESDRMFFGLLTGSYARNKSGGVLRKNIGTITDEIISNTGQFKHNTDATFNNDTTQGGIIKTIDKLRIVGFNYGDYSYNQDCGWITTEPLIEGHCRMWGNPIAEMMYESLRYFAGTKSPTPDFVYSGTTDDSSLGLPLVTWKDPYQDCAYCAKPFMLVISDINPSFDTDQLPGSVFNSSFSGSSLGTLNVGTLANTISNNEGISGNYFIGERGGATPAYDSSCSPKSITGLGDIRGLCPEEPTKQGGYYSASVAYYGAKPDVDIHPTAQGGQHVTTYTVALASPLPRIYVPVGGKTITLVPFAKSVGGCLGVDGTQGGFQPTNTIVDFYVDTLTPTYGKFRINFEDVEQGADHDMDAIAIYEYQVSGNQVTITLTSEYAAGCIMQHMGYIISGTTADGTYLEIRDNDTGAGSDVNYFLDTPQHAGSALPLAHSRTFSPNTGASTAASLLQNPLWYAAKWGGFEDSNSNGLPDVQDEWDKDHNGVPDNYFYVSNPLKLEEQLNKSFADILRRSSSGTAASVISSSRSGEGALYQAIFYPEYKDEKGNTVNWVGEVHALMVDSYGNMREDTNGNHQLDLGEDYIIEFSSTSPGTVYKYRDGDPTSTPPKPADGQLDSVERASPIVSSSMRSCNSDDLLQSVTVRECVSYLWSADNWVNKISDGDILSQRAYNVVGNKRHIFTFIDGKNGSSELNMVPDAGEVVDFIDTETSIYPYIHLYPPFGASAPSYIESIRTSNATVFSDFLTRQSKRVINYIRGQDQGSYTSSTSPSYIIPSFRSRQSDYDQDGTVETWRLGDIVYSTPTIVATPPEDYDLLYRDESYSDFYRKYRNRRTVVYAGGNDGMLHAFNGGYYDPVQKKFWKAYSRTATPQYSDTGMELGAELWGYIPYNLLPHLYWLTESTYNKDVHVAYVDLKPRIFDAKIFPADSTHVNGWGTIMVCGMRLGGGKIRSDSNKADGLTYNASNGDRTMTSAFFIMDITDPDATNGPTLLAEISSDELGYTTCYPTVFAMKDKVTASDQNKWYLVLGSGPHGSSTLGSGATGNALTLATSDQPGKVVILDLKELALNHTVETIDSDGVLSSGIHMIASVDSNSFISDPISVDFDLDYKADAIYFGTVSGSFASNTWGGKLRRIVIENDMSPANWIKDSTLMDLASISAYDSSGNVTSAYGYGQPIVAAPSVGQDRNHERWIFFGTGRFFNRNDASHATASHLRSYYGIKEPKDASGDYTWATVSRGDLLNVSNAQVFNGGYTVSGVTGASSFGSLQNIMLSKSGWLLDFATSKERNLGQATLLGDVLTFTTYIPATDVCQFEGTSNLYATDYGTGTAFGRSVIGLSTTSKDASNRFEVLRMTTLGKGLTITPNIHTGKEEGSEAYVQTSTGTILKLDELNPGMVKSGKTAWQEWDK